jgi:hypothetical protein
MHQQVMCRYDDFISEWELVGAIFVSQMFHHVLMSDFSRLAKLTVQRLSAALAP